MSGGSGTNNSWTILSSEGTVAETLRPFAAGTEQHEEIHPSSTGSGERSQPAKSAASAGGLPVGDHPLSEEKSDHPSSPPSEVSDTVDHGDKISPMEGQAEGPAQSGSDPKSSSVSYTLLTPLDGAPPGQAEFKLAEEEETVRLGNKPELQPKGEESEQQPWTADADAPVGSEVNEDRTQETAEKESEERRKKSLLAALEQIGRREEEEDEEEEFQEPQQENNGVFSLNKCILGAVLLLALGTMFFSGVFMDLNEDGEHAANELRDTEAAGRQEGFSPEVPPHTDTGSAELLNKLDEGSRQISALQAQLQAQKEELKVAKEQTAEGVKERLLWEEVEKENSRLKTEVASLPVLQKENDRMKKELESVPALQKELETLRSTVTKFKLSSAADKRVEAEASLSTPPPPGQTADSTLAPAGATDTHTRTLWDEQKEKKDLKKGKYETSEKKRSKEEEKSARKDGEQEFKKEWKKEKRGEGMLDKEKEKARKQKRQSDEVKDWKREKPGRGDDGKHEEKEERGWKKGKDENEGKDWRGKEEKKNRQGGEEGREGWREEKDWKKVKESDKEKWERKAWKETGEKKEWKKDEWRDKNRDQGKEGKGKDERKLWEDGKHHGKEKDERKLWEDGKHHGEEKEERKLWEDGKHHGKENDERKLWEDGKHHGEEKEERKLWEDGKHHGEEKDERKSKSEKRDEEWMRKEEKVNQWKKEDRKRGEGERKPKNHQVQKKKEHRSAGNKHQEEHLYGDPIPPHSHRRPSVGHPEYWLQQRDRLRRHPRPPQSCSSAESCARSERLLPVTSPDFQDVLQSYLSAAEEAGVDKSRTGELKKLAAEFFKDGVFVHDQMSFQDFVEDLGDILEDLVEGDEDDEEDSPLEEQMEEFEKEVMEKFSVPGAGEKEKRIKAERRRESGQERG